MKKTLSSQEYNKMLREASDVFDAEMAKRDVAINNMTKKLEIIECANEFIETTLLDIYNSKTGIVNKVSTFNVNLDGTYESYGFMAHPKFKKEPIDIFNLKLVSGNTMFKNSLKCVFNESEDPEVNDKYINLIKSDNSIEKQIVFDKLVTDTVVLDYTLDSNVALGAARYNVIEIDPYLYGAYSIKSIEIFTSQDVERLDIQECPPIPELTLQPISAIGKTRIILDKKVKFYKVKFTFSVDFSTTENNVKVYPFGLKHIYFYEADFVEDSFIVLPIIANDYIEYMYDDITLYQAGDPIETRCENYGIEIYTDYINNTLTGKIMLSSDAKAYRIAKNTKKLYAKIPLIYKDKDNKVKNYLSLSGILFNYTTDNININF